MRLHVLGQDRVFNQKYASIFKGLSEYDDVFDLLRPVTLEKRVAEAIGAFAAASGKSGGLKNQKEVEEAGVIKLRRKLEALKIDIDRVCGVDAKAAAAAAAQQAKDEAIYAAMQQLKKDVVEAVAGSEARVRGDIAAGFKDMKKFIFNLSDRTVPCVVLVAPAAKGKPLEQSAASLRKLLHTLTTPRDEDAFRLHVLCEYGEPHFIEGHAGYPLHGMPGPRLARVLALVRGSVMVLKTANFMLSALLWGTTVVPSGWLDKVVESCNQEKVSAEVRRALLPQLRASGEPGADKLDDTALSKQLHFESGGVDANTLAALAEFLDDAESNDPDLVSWRKHLYRCLVTDDAAPGGGGGDKVMFCCTRCMATAKASGVALQRADAAAADPNGAPGLPPRASTSALSAAAPDGAEAGLDSHPSPNKTSDASGGCCTLQ
jgi:hypothetical protein